MYKSICRQAHQLSSSALAGPLLKNDWRRTLPARRAMWLEMLGLHPLPDRTPLRAAVTGSLKRADYVVEKLHFQSLPGAYVPGNLYRPANTAGRLPAVLYLCGHSKGKCNQPYQANPRWFAQHGYIALVLDPIQLGEAQGLHHGTYSHGRWDWYSRGYTPAGTEVWNAMRALDYLVSRPDVDPGRLGVTGISGGGAMAWFLGAADERVRCIAPVCQTGSIEQLIADRCTDGHCDCAFWINYYRWCTPDLGALIAPRPLLIAAGTEDLLWRPYAFREAFHRIHHQYAALGAAGKVRLVEDLTPHGYTRKIRQAVFTWFNQHLRNDPRPVTDDVTDYFEPEKNLLAFKGKPPRHDSMRVVDTLLVKPAQPPVVHTRAQWAVCRRQAVTRLRRLTFRHVPAQASPVLLEFRDDGRQQNNLQYSSYIFKNADGLELRTRVIRPADQPGCSILAFALPDSAPSGHYGRCRPQVSAGVGTACVEVRNTAATSVGPGYLWTLRRSYPLLGQTLPERQVADLLDGIAILRQQPFVRGVTLYGAGDTAVLAIYAAILDPAIAGVVLADLPASHTNPATPEFPGILRIGDLPHNLALLYPRPITLVGKTPAAYRWTEKLYQKLGQRHLIKRVHSLEQISKLTF